MAEKFLDDDQFRARVLRRGSRGTEGDLLDRCHAIPGMLSPVVPASVHVEEAQIVRSPGVPVGVIRILVCIHGAPERTLWQRIKVAWRVLWELEVVR